MKVIAFWKPALGFTFFWPFGVFLMVRSIHHMTYPVSRTFLILATVPVVLMWMLVLYQKHLEKKTTPNLRGNKRGKQGNKAKKAGRKFSSDA